MMGRLLRRFQPLGMGLAGGAIAAALTLRMAEPPSIPIAILDRGALLRSLDEKRPETEQKALIEQFEVVARHLSDAGYLVIDRGWVIAAPEEFYVDTRSTAGP